MHIFVLESLKKEDPKTGERIHEFLDEENISNKFHRFRTKEELFELLDIIQMKVVTEDILPFIHFDCHGNDDGIAAINDNDYLEFIAWGEILDKFIEIYKSSKKKSVISMSSCEGFNATKLVAKGKPCPYDYICGSFEKIKFDDSFNAFSTFYKNIEEGIDIFEAAVGIHNDPTLCHMNFMAIDSYTLFSTMIDNYKKEQLSQEVLSKRKLHLLEELLKTHPIPNKEQLDYLDRACSVEGQEEILQNYQNVFFSFK